MAQPLFYCGTMNYLDNDLLSDDLGDGRVLDDDLLYHLLGQDRLLDYLDDLLLGLILHYDLLNDAAGKSGEGGAGPGGGGAGTAWGGGLVGWQLGNQISEYRLETWEFKITLLEFHQK